MKILAIETSSTFCSLALSLDSVITTMQKEIPKQQAQLILPMLDELLKLKNIELNQLDAIAFGCGPGSFTGIRIATSVAQGLGFALNIPLIPISSLAALAQEAYDELGWQNCLAAIDARINEVYWGAYQANAAGLVELVGTEHVSPPTEVNAKNPCYGLGNAWEVYAANISFHPIKIAANRAPGAAGIAKLAQLKYTEKAFCLPEDALPVYLRDEVAVKAKKR